MDSLPQKPRPSRRPPLHRSISSEYEAPFELQNDLEKLDNSESNPEIQETEEGLKDSEGSESSKASDDENNSLYEDQSVHGDIEFKDDEEEVQTSPRSISESSSYFLRDRPLFYIPECAPHGPRHQTPPSYIKEPTKTPTTAKRVSQSVKNSELSQIQKILMVVLSAIGILMMALYFVPQDPSDSFKPLDINSIKQTFPTQEDSLWEDFESGIADVNTFERPSTFIFLYKEEAEKTMTDLIPQLTKYAMCNLTDCNKKPIELTPVDLNSARVVKDYGTLIEDYRHQLKENGVMVIKNLERVKGTSAQAFHTFCDEYTPLVAKSLFIFTMKVNHFPETGVMRFVEDFLRNRWSDIKEDIVSALITRITSMVKIIRA